MYAIRSYYDRGPQLLRGFDGELRERIGDELRKKGVEVRLQSNPARLSQGIRVTYEDGAVQDVDLA